MISVSTVNEIQEKKNTYFPLHSPCVIAGQHHSDCVCHHSLPVVVTDTGVLPRDAKQQVYKHTGTTVQLITANGAISCHTD